MILNKRKSGFTLVELLIVVGILAVLATVTVLILNPAQMISQSRDSNRMNDLQTLNKAINLSKAMGSLVDTTQAKRVYISLPDINGNVNDNCILDYPTLPALAAGWEYRCVLNVDLRRVDGNGWIPINFSSVPSIQPPLVALPMDPINNPANLNYYAYGYDTDQNTYAIASKLDSEKYLSESAANIKDGGNDNVAFETRPVAWLTGGGGGVCNNAVSYGLSSVFNPAITGVGGYISTTKFDSTTSLTVYKDNGNLDYGTAVAARVSGSTITFGSEYVFTSNYSNYGSAVALDSTRALIAYSQAGSGRAVIATVNPVTLSISYGTSVIIGAYGVVSASVLDSSNVLIAYNEAVTGGRAIIASVSGSTITLGSAYTFNPATVTGNISATTLDASRALIAYTDGNLSSGAGTAIIASVSGSTITFGSEYVFKPITSQISAVALDASRALIAYSDNNNSFYGTAIIASVSGSTITFGSEYIFNNIATNKLSSTLLSTNRVLISYDDATMAGTSIIGNISGNIISFGLENAFSGPIIRVSAIALDSSHAFIAFDDNGNGNLGTAVIATCQ